ncbi:iron ABC transporter substrate-binding protein [Enterococcus dispar]|jgi:iron complex transport system substrate-binding protein|nr:siderophore ABC transporter substrate-binding protein [Enterococcus dispar]OJG37905.1 iron ABC transporter substrate-binding protein [Enterococcus dispar]
MMKKTVFMLVAATFMILTGCSNSAAKTEATKDSQVKSEVTIQDANGEITVPKAPQKVVVFDNSALDTMNVLGVGDKVVGAATDNLPDFLKSYKNVASAGGIKEPDLEKINALKPDLIIISGRQRDFQKDLEKIAPTIFFSTDNKDTWKSIQNQVNAIAQIFDKEAEAKKEIATLQEKIDATKKKAANSGKALVLLANEGSISAYGKGSRFGIVHDTFGFKEADETIKASTHGQNVSYEYVLEKNPAIIFVVDRTKAIGGDASQNQVAANELVKQTAAGKNQKVISLDPSVWYLAGSGLESVKIMIENVNKAF